MNFYINKKNQLTGFCSVLAVVSVLWSGANYESHKKEQVRLEEQRQTDILEAERTKIYGEVLATSMEIAYTKIAYSNTTITPEQIRKLNSYLHEQESLTNKKKENTP